VEGSLEDRLGADSSIAVTGSELKRVSFRDLRSCCCTSFLERVMGDLGNPENVIPVNAGTQTVAGFEGALMMHCRAPVSMKMWEPLVRPLTPERRLAFSTEAFKIAAEGSGSHFPLLPVRREATGFRLAPRLAGMTTS
jgi:hypothetical protein